MSAKKEIDQLIKEHPEQFDELDCGDLHRETGVNVPVPDWMKDMMKDADNQKHIKKND